MQPSDLDSVKTCRQCKATHQKGRTRTHLSKQAKMQALPTRGSIGILHSWRPSAVSCSSGSKAPRAVREATAEATCSADIAP